MKLSNHRARGRASGFTMLEVLISIVVIAFGMLGIAGLQAYALKNSQSASQRSIATVLASDMIDRIQANPLGATDGFYNEGSATGVAAASVPACLGSGCGGTSLLAANDLFEWKAAVKAALPKAVGIVCIDDVIGTDAANAPGDTAICSGVGTQYVIYIWWSDDRNRANTTGTPVRFATAFHI